MCGLVGIFDTKARSDIDRALLERMNAVQYHRGPDEGGVHIEPGLGLGHRRLSIIDLSHGQQPLFNSRNDIGVVYNGEIYNFRELREDLKKCGYGFKTDCDTEVIVYAWEEWGERCVEKFRGMFAFALWDRAQRVLFLARDRLGIKPLYYTLLPDGRFLFASELKSLLVCPDLRREVDPTAAEDYFAFGYIPDPKTIFKNSLKLAAGHTLTLKHGQPMPAPNQYWDVPFHTNNVSDEASIHDELIARLREAVNIRLVSDVPLGAFLSGGVDSSAVVAMMAESATEPVNTCSISFGDPEFNESTYADMVAQRFGTAHRVNQVDVDDFDLVDKLASLYDEPYADSSAMPTYRVCELARQEVTVALSGDGGDENFAGYRRYKWHMYEENVRSFLPQSIRGPLFGTLGDIYPKIDWAPKVFRAKSTLQALGRSSLAGYLHSVSVIPDHLRKELYSAKFNNELQGYNALSVLTNFAEAAPTDHPLSLVQYLDFKTYLPGDILTKVDRASMAHSLEVRVPILDHELVEWISGLSPDLKLKGSEGKYIFKKSLGNHLPKDVLYRPKMGFGVPLAGWFRGPLREKIRTVLYGSRIRDAGIFDNDVVTRMVEQHQSGARDHSAALWTMLMYDSFLGNVDESAAEASDSMASSAATG